jgi:hypothetical protein
MAKEVAKSLKSVLEDPAMKIFQDRTQNPVPAAEGILKEWTFDLFTRKPGPAYTEDGVFVGTDLDMATFLSALADREAVVAIPSYEGMRAATKTEGVRHLPGPRNGSILGLIANKDVFSFSVRMRDMSVVRTDANGREHQGDFRNFSLVDVHGEWHDGWKRIEFVPNAKENAFLNDKSLWDGATLVLSNFVHPNRWVSLYGNPYFKAKAALESLTSYAAHLRKEVKRLEDAGYKYVEPSKGGFSAPDFSAETVYDGDSEPVSVETLEVELDLPEPSGEYPKLASSDKALKEAADLAKYISYTLCSKIRFTVRCVEYAFFKYGFQASGEEKIPGWITGASWERGFKLPKGRIEWNRMILFQRAVGEMGIGIRYRKVTKTQRVKAQV